LSGVWDRERRALSLGLLIAVFAFAIEGMGVVPALPTAARALSGLPLFGWVFSAFTLAGLVGTLGGGQLADRRGPRLPIALGLSAFAAGLLLSAAAQNMPQFLLGRILQGLGGGVTVAVAYVVIARGYPDALRPRIMALFSSAWILPALVGPLVSGMVAERLSWRLVFAGILPFLALGAALLLPTLGQFSQRRPPAPDEASRLPTALGLALGMGLVLGLPNLQARGPIVVGLAALGGAGLLFVGLRRLLPAGTLRGKAGLPAGILTRGLLAWSFFGAEAFVPFGTSELRGASPTVAGLTLTAGSLGWTAAAWLQERLEARGGPVMRRKCVRAGFLFLIVSIAVVALALMTRLPFLLIPLGWAVGGFGVGLAYSASGLLCISAARAGQEGEVSGQLQLMEALGTAAGTGLGGGLLLLSTQLGRTPRLALLFTWLCTIVVAMVGALLSSRLPLPQPDPRSDVSV
jgi:MFS family permease